MNGQSKSINSENFSSITETKSTTSRGDKKNSGYNDWSSVPVTYDKEDSTHKHEKTATNNQWRSTSK